MKRVFKFGGASVKDAESVRNIPRILADYQEDELVIIISAMNKTTNALEELVDLALHDEEAALNKLEEIKTYHHGIAKELFNEYDPVFDQLNSFFGEMKIMVEEYEKASFDLFYDQLVPYGELLSTYIISHHLSHSGIKNKWLDARKLIITDNTFRAARVNWEESKKAISAEVASVLMPDQPVITQGFIGSDGKHSTTLGREGSDFSAAIFASILDAEEMIVWKDVPGYLNADPKYFNETVKLDRISYSESIELAFYGAKIIHPKTIRPLQNKGIPLYVKSFERPADEGSIIQADISADASIPSCIIKEDQVLISISSRDFSFIAEGHLHLIFGLFAKHRCGINLMQNSAISFSVCVDKNERLEALIRDLQVDFKVKYNDNLRLITIRHYDAETIRKLTLNREILMEQRSRITAQMLVK
jgi:aspartate kinase